MDNKELAMTCDVLVVGAGIAGIMAAIEAAREKQKVVLMSGSHIFSGSSFYPGTWGLGLITPEDEEDEEDLIQTIQTVGCGMADEGMVRSFVKEMRPTIAYLQEMGLQLKDAKEKNQKEFIPCFDHKTRSWHGVVADKARERFKELLQEFEVTLLPYCELVDVIEENRRIAGALVCERHHELRFIETKAVILATGGYGGLFEKKLTTSDITGTGQYIALEHGCTLVNMEFMQMMPALVNKEGKASEVPIIFNEKTFRYATLQQGSETDQTVIQCDKKILEQRATYGPFTSRMPSREIDFLIASHDKEGLQVRYNKELLEDMPEFIRTYFDWLKKKRNLTPDSDIRISMFAHAANGGIKINEEGATDLQGLFACGEVTGGMHGADRIGGLSSANGFVFGRRAGKAAAEYAKACLKHTGIRNKHREKELSLWEIANREQIKTDLQRSMMEGSMVIRSEKGLHQALETIITWKDNMIVESTTDVKAYVDSRKLWAQLQLATGILQAERLRKESRGSHYRADYPSIDSQYAKRIEIKLQDNCVITEFEEK